VRLVYPRRADNTKGNALPYLNWVRARYLITRPAVRIGQLENCQISGQLRKREREFRDRAFAAGLSVSDFN
jgi:hypothetical protein